MAQLNKRSMVVTVAATDYTAQVSVCALRSRKKDSDFVTFADAAAGGAREYYQAITMVQDLATGTLWDKIWTVPGTSVAVLLKPYGNAVASAAQPHYSGNLTITEPDGDLIGGEADASVSARNTVEVEWVWDAKPTKITS
jgi:hypothetical protein